MSAIPLIAFAVACAALIYQGFRDKAAAHKNGGSGTEVIPAQLREAARTPRGWGQQF